jgi:hypothetical protein
MWQLFGRLFGNKNVVDSVIGGIDKSVFTREEKADYLLKFLSAYEPYKLAQRILAIMFSSVFLMAFIVAFIVFSYGSIVGNMEIVKSGKDILGVLSDVLGLPISLILGFYFAGGTINSFMRKYDTKKNEIVKEK